MSKLDASTGELNISEDDFNEQFERAMVAGLEAAATEPRATYARYHRFSDTVIIALTNGVQVHIPRHLIQGLGQVTPCQAADLHLSGDGSSIHWEHLDLDLSIPCLVSGIFGTKAWMSELGKKGGKSTSSRKVAASKTNGRKGGRPRKDTLSQNNPG